MLSLFINCEIARIDNTDYYIANDICLQKVTKQEFKSFLEKLDWILKTDDEELKNIYLKMKGMSK